MEKRNRLASDPGKTVQSLSDQDLASVGGGAAMVTGLGGPDTREDKVHQNWITVSNSASR
jgi:hypothetical protein